MIGKCAKFERWAKSRTPSEQKIVASVGPVGDRSDIGNFFVSPMTRRLGKATAGELQ